MECNDSSPFKRLPLIAIPQWWYIEITDGYGAHHNSLRAMKLPVNGKCLSVKEEGNSSQMNQAYYRFVAKGDKKQGAN